ARRAHNPKVAGSDPAPAIAAAQGVGLARALQTGRPGPRRPSVRAAFVVGLPGLNLRAGEPGGFGVHAGRSMARAEPKSRAPSRGLADSERAAFEQFRTNLSVEIRIPAAGHSWKGSTGGCKRGLVPN